MLAVVERVIMAEMKAPDSVKAFEARLLEVSAALPKRLRQCADYVASNPDRIAVSTVSEMAEGAGVQSSAFMRFCQIMGFSGFSEMQRLFRDTYVGNWPDYPSRMQQLRESGSGSPATLLAEFTEAGRVSLEGLLKTVEPAALDQAVNLLSQAQMIHIAGVRRSFPVASYLTYAFEKMCVPVMLHTSVGKMENLHAIREGDVILAISFSPYAEETVSMITKVCERHAEKAVPVVAITDTMLSPLCPVSDVSLLVSEVDFGAFRSLSATLCLAMTLAVAVGTTRQTV